MAVRLISSEVSVKDIAVSVVKSAFSICLAVLPVANVLGTVQPNLRAETMLKLALS
jgi:hypothetical protein